jgi:hypothetical protein
MELLMVTYHVFKENGRWTIHRATYGGPLVIARRLPRRQAVQLAHMLAGAAGKVKVQNRL